MELSCNTEVYRYKEQIIHLLDNVPDYKMGYALAYIQGLAAGEQADGR